jgi:SAM-dependent methyltransferase
VEEESLQSVAFSEQNQYTHGAPHLSHESVRRESEKLLRTAIASLPSSKKTKTTLEVGAGDGTYTDFLKGNNLNVTVTEMSEYSVKLLSERYQNDPSVKVILDRDGTWPKDSPESFDLLVCMSVLHHIPDYVEYLSWAFSLVEEGGAFVSWADPLWYPRRSRVNMVVDRGAYFAWRMGQGKYHQGLKTRIRRMRGHYDEALVEDVSEYHVVRSGVDEEGIQNLALEFFDEVKIIKYWGTQSRQLQKIGDLTGLVSTFGIIATGRKSR